MQTVGVAPGTTMIYSDQWPMATGAREALHRVVTHPSPMFRGLGEVYQGVAAKSINWIPARPCPPEEVRWFMPDRAEDPTIHKYAYPNGFQGLSQNNPPGTRIAYDLYQNDIWKLRGFQGLGGCYRAELCRGIDRGSGYRLIKTPTGSKCCYMGTFHKLNGLGVYESKIRWDLIGIVGGGAFAVALLASLIASR